MKRKAYMIPMTAVALGASLTASAQQSVRRPNIVIIITDQQRADLTAREGFPLNLTPFADSIARNGVWFNHAYTPCPASAPARVSLFTGRFPRVTHTDSNHNILDAVYGKDLFTVAKENGYITALVGKNHTYMDKNSADWWDPYNHLGQEGDKSKISNADKAFDRFLGTTSFYASFSPSPGTLEQQIPFRMVSDALAWVEKNKDKPYVLVISFPEPHNPYQVCEPYYSMFRGKVPPARTDSTALKVKGEKFVQLHEMMMLGHEGYQDHLDELRANYMGMIRLLDDQMARFVKGMEEMGQYDHTTFVITSDHGDYAGEYGLMKKGAGVVDPLTRIPMVWFGDDVKPSGHSEDHVSLIDIFPTECELMGAQIPLGVQGRSLTEMLSGRPYPKNEFRSVISEAGFGGEFFTKEDSDDYIKEGAVSKQKYFFDELNTWSQSGMISMVRMGDWKLVFDMVGDGELYNMKKDPSEMNNLFGEKRYAAIQDAMLQELLKWEIAINDPIPVPRTRYYFKRFAHNYLFNK